MSALYLGLALASGTRRKRCGGQDSNLGTPTGLDAESSVVLHLHLPQERLDGPDHGQPQLRQERRRLDEEIRDGGHDEGEALQLSMATTGEERSPRGAEASLFH